MRRIWSAVTSIAFSILLLVPLVGLIYTGFAPTSWKYEPAAVDHIENVRADIYSGRLKNAILELEGGGVALVLNTDRHGNVWVMLPDSNRLVENFSAKEDRWMKHILAINRVDDPTYSEVRTRLLPIQKRSPI